MNIAWDREECAFIVVAEVILDVLIWCLIWTNVSCLILDDHVQCFDLMFNLDKCFMIDFDKHSLSLQLMWSWMMAFMFWFDVQRLNFSQMFLLQQTNATIARVILSCCDQSFDFENSCSTFDSGKSTLLILRCSMFCFDVFFTFCHVNHWMCCLVDLYSLNRVARNCSIYPCWWYIISLGQISTLLTALVQENTELFLSFCVFPVRHQNIT